MDVPRPTSAVMTRLRLCGASLLAACALLAAGCGGGTSSSGVEATGEPISFEQLASSASTSAAAKSVRFSFDVSFTFAGADEPLALSGEGAFDTENERAAFSVDMSSLAKLLGGFVSGFPGADKSDLPDFDDPAGWRFEIVQDGDVGYVRLPAIDDQLPAGKTWVRGSAADLKAGGLDFEELDSFAQNDPREVLEALRDLGGTLETLGTDELRGVATTHYRATLDPADLVEQATGKNPDAASILDQLSGSGLAEMPLDIWIDGNGLVRKLALDADVPETSTGQAGRISLAFELWDYGEPVAIAVPPASQVADAAALRD
jgi:hypothetical protein